MEKERTREKGKEKRDGKIKQEEGEKMENKGPRHFLVCIMRGDRIKQQALVEAETAEEAEEEAWADYCYWKGYGLKEMDPGDHYAVALNMDEENLP